MNEWCFWKTLDQPSCWKGRRRLRINVSLCSAYCVPDLYFNKLPIDFDVLRTKLYTDRCIMFTLESIVYEFREYARLANACISDWHVRGGRGRDNVVGTRVADDDELEEIVVLVHWKEVCRLNNITLNSRKLKMLTTENTDKQNSTDCLLPKSLLNHWSTEANQSLYTFIGCEKYSSQQAQWNHFLRLSRIKRKARRNCKTGIQLQIYLAKWMKVWELGRNQGD